jgi:DNA-binding response OmpR family regulator
VICDDVFADGTWRDLLSDLQGEQEAPPLIVYSRMADNRLWAEVLNLGGRDVLIKPFHAPEVSRVVRMAARR